MSHARSPVRFYLQEALGLGGFVLIAGLISILLEHPELPAMQSRLADHPVWRRCILGVAMGIYMAVVVLITGKGSGAHINPAFTLGTLALRKITPALALGYILSQTAGAVSAALLLKFALGKWFGHPSIHYGITRPNFPHHSDDAFFAEFIISFILMLVSLLVVSRRKLEPYNPAIAGLMLCIFLIVELPFSGMSMNPARSLAGALAAQDYRHLWIYFAAPIPAMLLAVAFFKRLPRPADWQPVPHFPIPVKNKLP